MAAVLLVVGAIGFLFGGFTGAAVAIVLTAVAFVVLNLVGGVLDGLPMRWLARPTDAAIVQCARCGEPHLRSYDCISRTKPQVSAAAYCMTCKKFHDNTIDCGAKKADL